VQYPTHFINATHITTATGHWKCITAVDSGQGQGQGYITTNNQSVSMSWYRAQSRTIDQSLLSP
jgi:hypothetical protein